MSLSHFLASIESPALLAVAEHWNAARADRLMPAWQDIDPATIKIHLPIVWAWRRAPPLGTLIGRLAGEDIVSILGTTPRGKSIEECFTPEARELVRSTFVRVIDGPALMHNQGVLIRLEGAKGWGERIALPLAADHVHGDGLIGATVYHRGSRAGLTDKVTDQVPDFYPIA
jgi:hypothetical protein